MEVPPLKKAVIVSAAVLVGMLLVAGIASAERFVMVTHTQGTDPFWPVVQKGGEDAARAVGADFEYNFAPSGDMADMARLIEAAVATQPDGIVVSLPDADALGGAIRSAVEAGIPVITMNSGLESSAAVGALMHVGTTRAAGRREGGRARQGRRRDQGDLSQPGVLQHRAGRPLRRVLRVDGDGSQHDRRLE